MPLRFRSIVPYIFPGVVALIGWWWYTSRKKEWITGHNSEEGQAMGLLASPGESSNGIVDKDCQAISVRHGRTSQERPKAKEQRPAEQEVVAQVHAPATKASSGEPLSSSAIVEASGKLDSSHSKATTDSLQSSPEAFRQKPPVPTSTSSNVVEKTSHKRPVAAALSDKSRQLPTVGELDSVRHAELPKAERPEPEGGVADDILAVAFAENVQADLVKDSLSSTKDDLPPKTLTVLDQCAQAVFQHSFLTESPVVSASFPLSASTPVSDNSIEAKHHENGDVSESAKTSNSMEELHRLATGLITQVITAATQEVMAVSSCEEAVTGTEDSGCSTCQSEDGISSEDLLLSTGLSSTVPERKEDLIQISGISRSSEEKEDGLQESSDLTGLEEPTLTAEHVAAVCEVARLNGAGLRNGTSEAEADQSGGSDVNSMDSVDSCSTLGTGDGQQSGSQSSQSQSSELIVWEIEVPKHLVGRLIGKQGRYVSFLKQSSGAKIYISTLPYTQEFQICHIEGTQQQVDKALALIGKKFKDLDLTNLYAPPPLPLSLPSLPMTSWLLLPNGVTVEVIVVNIVSAGHVFVQQHTHPTYHALRSLDQQMFLCYSQPGTPALPSPAEVGVICAAPAVDGAWWRAQVISFYKDSNEVEIRYVDYGGYDRVKIDTLRQIRSDFVTLPFQGTEVLLDNIAPLPGEDRFSTEATSALEEMTRGVPLLAQVTNYDNNTGLPLVQMWNMVGDDLVQLNRTLAERGFATWVDSF
uniref:Tudor domain-containing protein n=1 Tax=Pygocentrus nattereri TaxID=42514 RepID=A0AAR2M2V4_PYGNA